MGEEDVFFTLLAISWQLLFDPQNQHNMPIKLVSSFPVVPDPRQMTPGEYNDAHGNMRYFRTSTGQALGCLAEDVRWSSMVDLIRQSNIAGFKGIVFYHGLVGDELRYGLRVVEMRPLGYNPRMEDFEFSPMLDAVTADLPTHEISGANNAIVPVQHGSWATWILNYRNIEVDRHGDQTWNQLDFVHEIDPLKVIFPWEDEVFLLWLNNRTGIGSHEPFLNIRSISRDHSDDPVPGYRHGIGMHMRYFDSSGTHDLLQPTNQIIAYHNAAADLGHRCPPRCRYYKVPRS